MTLESDKISFEGSLSEYPFPRVLQFLHEHNVTGRLVLRKGELTKVVFFVDSKPVNVDSTIRDETLGRYLIKKGRITEEEFQESINLMIEQNIQQGAALVKMGKLSPKELYHEVKSQTQEKLVSCFGWISGEFGFYPDIEFVEDIYRFEMNVPLVLKEGIRRFMPPGAVEGQLAKVPDDPVMPVPGFMDKIGVYDLSDKESALIMAIDGERNLKELKKFATSDQEDVKTLYLLMVTGLAGPNGDPDTNLRGLGDLDFATPPVDEFLRSSQSAPEVVEEEYEIERPDEKEERGDFNFSEDFEEEGGLTAETPEEETPVFEEDEEGPSISIEAEEAEEETPAFEEEEEDVSVSIEVEESEEDKDHFFKEAPSEDEIMDEPIEEEEEIELGPRPRMEEDEVEAPPLDDEAASVLESEETETGEVSFFEEAPGVGEEIKDESEVLEAYMTVKSSDFFELLGVSRDAGDLDVDRAYRALRAEWDKSRFSPELSDEVMDKLEEINTQLIRAYEALRTEESRKEYLEKIEGEPEPDVRPGLQAEQCLQKGMQFVRSREWASAQKMFERAVEARPHEAEYRAYLGWTIYSNTELDLEERKDKAKSALMEAIDSNPQIDAPHVFIAKIFKEEGQVEKAVSHFEQALVGNPNCREAERELMARKNGEW